MAGENLLVVSCELVFLVASICRRVPLSKLSKKARMVPRIYAPRLRGRFIFRNWGDYL